MEGEEEWMEVRNPGRRSVRVGACAHDAYLYTCVSPAPSAVYTSLVLKELLVRSNTWL